MPKTGRQGFKSEIIVSLAEYFNVSADYLLMGVSAENKAVHDITRLDDSALAGLIQYADDESELLLNRLLMDEEFYLLLSDLKRLMKKRIKAINVIEFNWNTIDANMKIEEERITKSEMADLCEWRMKQAVENYFSIVLGLK